MSFSKNKNNCGIQIEFKILCLVHSCILNASVENRFQIIVQSTWSPKLYEFWTWNFYFTISLGSALGSTLAYSKKHWKLKVRSSFFFFQILLDDHFPFVLPPHVCHLSSRIASTMVTAHRFAKAMYHFWTSASLHEREKQLKSCSCHLNKNRFWTTKCVAPKSNLFPRRMRIKVYFLSFHWKAEAQEFVICSRRPESWASTSHLAVQ